MIFAKFSKLFNVTSLIALAVAVSVPVDHAAAQDAGYVPPPMFEDMTPPMVRPEGNAEGNIVAPKVSPNTVILPSNEPRPAMVMPRVSVDPDSGRVAPVTPSATTSPPAVTAPVAPQAPIAPVPPVAVPAAPVVTPPAPPKMMQPIVEETYIKRQKPPAKVETKKPDAVKPVVPPKKPAAPVQEDMKTDTTVPAPQAPVIAPAPVQPPAVAKETPAPVAPPVPVENKPAVETPRAPEAVMPKAVEMTAPVVPSTVVPAKSSVDDRTQQPAPKRNPQESAIKGPKVMPSLPVQGVEGEVTYEAAPLPPSGETILERHQKPVEDTSVKDIVPIVPAPKPGVTPATFDSGEQGALKKTIVYAPGQVGLAVADADPIAAGVSTELAKEENKEWRVQIRSFATPHGTGVSSDRRIALSRALSLRTALITQGVVASKIDVLAEGLQTDVSKPGDRVDLYLYGPKTN